MNRFTVAKEFLLPAIALILMPCISFSQDFQSAPNDSLFPMQQRLFEKLRAPEAWKLTQGNPDVLIGVIDNGFDFYHPDLIDQLIPGFYSSGGYHQETAINIGHGTMIASIISARTNNVIGMAGLAPKCRIMTASYGMTEHALLKLQREFTDKHPDAGLADFQKELANHQKELEAFGKNWITYISKSNAEAIRYLVDHGVRVINISGFLSRQIIVMQSPESWDLLESAFSYARGKGVIIVLSAGNQAQEVTDYPGDDSTTIIAGASLLDDSRWEEDTTMMQQKIKQGSCYGKRLTVMAPVDSLAVCVPHEKRFYNCDDGPAGPFKADTFEGMYEIERCGATSCAAPIVTALVALVYSLRPDLDAQSVVDIIKKGCDDIGDKGYEIYTGYGRVNFIKTLELARKRTIKK